MGYILHGHEQHEPWCETPALPYAPQGHIDMLVKLQYTSAWCDVQSTSTTGILYWPFHVNYNTRVVITVLHKNLQHACCNCLWLDIYMLTGSILGLQVGTLQIHAVWERSQKWNSSDTVSFLAGKSCMWVIIWACFTNTNQILLISWSMNTSCEWSL